MTTGTNIAIDSGLYQIAPLSTCDLQVLNGCGSSYGPASGATFTDGPIIVVSGTAAPLFTGPDAGHVDSVVLVLSANASAIASLGSQTIQLVFNGQSVTFSAANFASSYAEGFPTGNISGIGKGQVNGISFSSSLHAAVDFDYATLLNALGPTGTSLGAVTVNSPIDLRVDVFGDRNGVIVDNAANSGAEGVKGVAGDGSCPANASLGDFVWLDGNANGVQDSGESGVAGVSVALIGAGSDGKFGTTDDVTLATTTTDGSGQYAFRNLNAGQYRGEIQRTRGRYLHHGVAGRQYHR